MGRVKPDRRRTRNRQSTHRRNSHGRRPSTPTTFKQKGLLVALGIGIVVIALALLEGTLRVMDYRGPLGRAAALSGIEEIRPLFRLTTDASGADIYTTCSDRLTFFNRQEFAARKKPGTFRIFCFGGSSTYGRPYRCETAFPRWMELILNSPASDHHFEVINVGGISYASYRVVNLVREVLESDYDPDLLVVYSGHNEFLENWTYDHVLDSKGVLHRARTFLDRFRCTHLFRRSLPLWRSRLPAPGAPAVPETEVDAILDRSAGLDYYVRDDEQHERTFDRYERCLEEIVEMAHMRGVPLVLVTVVSNLKDFSPFKSSHREGLSCGARARWDSLYTLGCSHMDSGDIAQALRLFTEAAEIDARYADLQFSIARCLEVLGRPAAAESCYVLAKDEDICPLRAPERINEAIERVSRRYRTPLVDLRSHLREIARRTSGNPILGNDLFLDHLHLTIEGYQLMALAIVECLEQAGLVDTQHERDNCLLEALLEEVEASLDAEYRAQMHLNLGKVLSWAGKTEEAAPHLALAARMSKGSAEAHYRIGKTHREAGRTDEAMLEFRKALDIDADYAAAHNDLGFCYLAQKRVNEAEACFRKAAALRPDRAMPHVGLGRCYAVRGLLDEAISAYERAVAIQSDYAEGLNNLAVAYQDAKRFDDAEATFRRALDLYPDFIEARNNLGLLYLALGQRAMAEAEFRSALQSKPDAHQTYGNLGITLMLKGDRAGAAAMFRKVLELHPEDPDAARLLASLE